MNEGFLLSICNDVTHIHVKLIKLLHCCMLHRENEQQQQQPKKYANLLIKSVSVFFFVFIFISEIGSMLDNAFFRYFISILYIQFFSTREQASKWEKEIVEARRGERGLWRCTEREREQNVIINCNSNAYYKVNNVMTMNLCLRAVMRFQDW